MRAFTSKGPSIPPNQWTSSKLRDDKDELGFGFRLVQHQVGIDSDGDPETSCSVEPEVLVLQKPGPQGSSQKPAYRAIKKLITGSTDTGIAGAPFSANCIEVESTVEIVASDLVTVQSNKRSNRARNIINNLIAGGYLRSGIEQTTDEGWIWLPDD